MRLLLMILLATAPADPVDAPGWFKLGISRHDAGDYRGALAAYERAVQMKFGQPFQLWQRQARAHAKLGESDAAFALLQKLASNGFAQADLINGENDYIPIRLDNRYAEAIGAMRRNAHACTSPEFRQFDYWLGEWDVEANGQKIARSSIQLILDECVIFENYEAARGYSGKSFSVFEKNEGKWQQCYVDTGGGFHRWTDGHLDESGSMTFRWDYTLQGQKTLNRMTYVKEGPDKVRQILEASTDDGKTWSQTYNGLYTRRK
jgi:tetratricopeptide (TPR) repeat protein